MSRLDQIYRRLLLTKFFTKGWGNPDDLKRIFDFRKILSCRDACQDLVPANYPVHIDQDQTRKGVRLIEGHFASPFTLHLPNIMPPESEIARFQMVLPHNWDARLKPVCIHLAGTGDHYFWRRRTLLARPLLKEAGIASIILENPYYGVRKPKQQLRSSLRNVSDLFVMGGALVLESIVLLRWCEQQGYGPLGMTGISMGGHMASLAASSWPKPISLVPCLSWSTASTTFTQGVLSGAIPWKLLQDQYYSNSIFAKDLSKLIESPEGDFVGSLAPDLPPSAFPPSAFPPSGSPISHPSELPGPPSPAVQPPIHADAPSPPVHPRGAGPVPNSAAGAVLTGGASVTSIRAGTSGTGPTVAAGPTGATATPTVRFHTTTSNKEDSGAKPRTSSLMATLLRPVRAGVGRTVPSSGTRRGRQEALAFMRGVMDECTHLGNFSPPVDPSLVIIVAARSDAYIPRQSVLSLEQLWPGAEVRYIETGHITAFLFHQDVFRKAIVDAFDRQIQKYHSSSNSR